MNKKREFAENERREADRGTKELHISPYIINEAKASVVLDGETHSLSDICICGHFWSSHRMNGKDSCFYAFQTPRACPCKKFEPQSQDEQAILSALKSTSNKRDGSPDNIIQQLEKEIAQVMVTGRPYDRGFDEGRLRELHRWLAREKELYLKRHQRTEEALREGYKEGKKARTAEILKIIERVSKYKSEINDFVNIGRQNAINDIENEIEGLK